MALINEIDDRCCGQPSTYVKQSINRENTTKQGLFLLETIPLMPTVVVEQTELNH